MRTVAFFLPLVFSLTACEVDSLVANGNGFTHKGDTLTAAPCTEADLEFKIQWKDANGRCKSCQQSSVEIVVTATNRCATDVAFTTDTGCMISNVFFNGKFEDFAYEDGLMCTEAITTHQIAANSKLVHAYPLSLAYEGDWYADVEIDLHRIDLIESEVQIVARDF